MLSWTASLKRGGYSAFKAGGPEDLRRATSARRLLRAQWRAPSEDYRFFGLPGRKVAREPLPFLSVMVTSSPMRLMKKHSLSSSGYLVQTFSPSIVHLPDVMSPSMSVVSVPSLR